MVKTKLTAEEFETILFEIYKEGFKLGKKSSTPEKFKGLDLQIHFQKLLYKLELKTK